MSRRSETPQTPLLQVYADEACTIRPQVGQTYSELWVKVNKTVDQDVSKEWGEVADQFTVASILGGGEELGFIRCYIDMGSDDFEGAISPGVYMLAGGESITITAPLVVDFYE